MVVKKLSQRSVFGLLVMTLNLYSSFSLAGGACSSLADPKPIDKSIDDLTAIKNQNQILSESFGIKKPRELFCSFLSINKNLDLFGRHLRLGRIFSEAQINDLFSDALGPKDSYLQDSFGYGLVQQPVVAAESERRILLKPQTAYLLVQVNKIAFDRIQFRFGAFILDYREELVKPHLSEQLGADASLKFVQAVEHGGSLEWSTDFAIVNESLAFWSNFETYESVTSIPVNPRTQSEMAKRDQALALFKKLVDSAIQVKNALHSRNLITWKGNQESGRGFRTRKGMLPKDENNENLSESELLIKRLVHFASIPLDLDDNQASNRKWIEASLIFHLADCDQLPR